MDRDGVTHRCGVGLREDLRPAREVLHSDDPAVLELTADVSDDFLGGDGQRFPIAADRAGQIILPLAIRVVEADILVASTRTEKNSGFASRTTTVRIR